MPTTPEGAHETSVGGGRGRRGRRGWTVRLIAAAGVIALLAGVGVVAVNASDTAARYRTATATTTEVAETRSSVATVEPIRQASVAFPTSGTVDSVVVEVGDAVEVGDRLAGLDDSDLRADLRAARSALADAELTLERARNGEDPAGGAQLAPTAYEAPPATGAEVVLVAADPGPVPADEAPAPSETPTASDPGGGSIDTTQIRKAQDDVLVAKQSLDTATRAAEAALENAYAACAGARPSTNDPGDAPDDHVSTAPAAKPEYEPSPTPSNAAPDESTAPDDPPPPDNASDDAPSEDAGTDDPPSAFESPSETASEMAVYGGGVSVVFTAAKVTPVADQNVSSGCLDALSAAAAAQQEVTNAQQQLDAAASTLDELISALLDDLEDGSGGGPGEPAPSEQPSPGGSGPGGPGEQPEGQAPDSPGGQSPQAPDGQAPGGQPDGGAPGMPGGQAAPDVGGQPGAGGGPSDLPGGQSPSVGSGATSSPSSADLIAYQEAVDASKADVAVAKQALEQATLVSPIAGHVTAVTLTSGDEVTADNADAAVTIEGAGGYELTTTVPVDSLPDIELGQPVDIVADGTERVIAGEVVRVGVTGSTDGASTTYPVTIAVTDADTAGSLRNGALASVDIVTGQTQDAVAVPTSAVTNTNGITTVDVLHADGTASTTRVQTGVVGETWTEIVGGLEAGAEVVLADLNADLPSSATDSSSQSGDGGFPGGGFPGGGGQGGGPPGGFGPPGA